MKRLYVLFNFYKLFIVWSLVINIIIGSINPNYFAAILTKLFLIGFAWYFISETSNRRKLTFYKNLGISPVVLFTFIFITDTLVTIVSIFLIKQIN
jgi:hypothetical protein